MASQLRLLALLYNIAVAAVGIAVAYGFTSVHRAPLPRDEIEALPSITEQLSDLWPQVQIDVSVAGQQELCPEALRRFVDTLSRTLGQRAKFSIADSSITASDALPCMGSDTRMCLDALEMRASGHTPVLSNRFQLLLIASEDGSSIIFGADKRLFVRWQPQAMPVEEMATVVSHHLEASWLRHALNEGVTLFEITPGYVFSFFLVGDCHARVSWDFRVLSPFLSRFLERLQMLFDIELNSQVVQCGSLGTPLESPEQARATVDASMLQADFMRRTGEWPADALTRDARWLPPLVRLVAFKPSTAVKLEDERGQVQHSFALQGFGAVAIAECQNQTGSPAQHSLTPCEAEKVATGWISSLRSWLSLPASESIAQGARGDKIPVLVARPRFDGISDWELEILARAVQAQFLRRTAETLRSLVELVDSLPDVVVREEIAAMAFKAASKTRASIDAAAKGDLLLSLVESRQALMLALTAIHDDSVVSQLYFSWEFKYAVYLPISMPILVPIVTSTWRVLQSWLPGRKKA